MSTIFAHSEPMYLLKEIYKKCPDTDNTEISFRGLSLSHTHIGFSKGFNSNFPTIIPFTFIQCRGVLLRACGKENYIL